jgi:hypothetical protein
MRSPNDVLDDRRARLRDELQRAFGVWLLASGRGESFAEAQVCVDTANSDCQSNAEEWSDYLSAKRRLTSAYAEQRVTA